MLKCYCNEPCFYYKKTSIVEIDCKKYMQTHNFNKCNRLPSDNTKKTPCDFNSKKLIQEKLIEEKCDNQNAIVSKHNNKILTYKDVYDIIYKMLEHYYINSTNFFGKLNYYLKLIGYTVHVPTKESLEELKTRLSKRPSNLSKIYINKESFFSKSEGEFDYDYDNEVKIFQCIIKGEDPLNWVKDEFIQNILKRKSLKKSKKSIKSMKSMKYDNSKSDNSKSDDYIEEQLEKNSCADSDEEKSNEEESDDEFDDEKDNVQNLKDNEFDIEEFSDDDDNLPNDEYDDFSD